MFLVFRVKYDLLGKFLYIDPLIDDTTRLKLDCELIKAEDT